MMTRHKFDEIGEVTRHLTALGCSSEQIARHTEQLRVANQPKPKKPTEPSQEQMFDGWTSGRAC
jgi:hypothetical protein